MDQIQMYASRIKLPYFMRHGNWKLSQFHIKFHICGSSNRNPFWTKALSFHMQVDGQGSPRQTTVYAHSYRQNPFNDYKVKCLMNTGNESELPNQTVTLFDWSLKKHAVMFSWWKILHFLLTNSKWFSSDAAFSWSNREQYLRVLNFWFSRRNS